MKLKQDDKNPKRYYCSMNDGNVKIAFSVEGKCVVSKCYLLYTDNFTGNTFPLLVKEEKTEVQKKDKYAYFIAYNYLFSCVNKGGQRFIFPKNNKAAAVETGAGIDDDDGEIPF